MKIRRSLLKDTVDVETRLGEGAYGTSYDEPKTGVPCNVDAKRRLVRNGEGDETVSEATLHLHPQTRLRDGTTVDPVEVFTPESRVTIGGRPSTVIDTKAHTLRGRVAFVEVMVT